MNMKNQTYLYCDTEFNGFGGELISMALVNPEDNSSWYGVKSISHMQIHPWVLDNVVPKLYPEMSVPINGEYEFRKSLWQYVGKYKDTRITIVADWPEDLAFFASHMCWSEGQRPRINFDLRLISTGHMQTTDPHNALADACDLSDWCHENKDKWE